MQYLSHKGSNLLKSLHSVGGKALDSFPAIDWFMSHDLPLTTADCPFCIVLWVKVWLCFCLFGVVYSLTSSDQIFGEVKKKKRNTEKHSSFNQKTHSEQKGALPQPLLARFICESSSVG